MKEVAKDGERGRKMAKDDESKKGSERTPAFASSYERSPKAPH